MKTSYLITITLLFVFSNCDSDYKPKFENGKTTALKNGVSWSAEGRGTENSRRNGVDILFDVFNENGYLIERLGFVKIPVKIGGYSIHNTFSQTVDSLSGSTFKTIEDSDVTEDRYIIKDDEYSDSIWIDSFDKVEGIISGRFKSIYNINFPKKNPNNPDSIIFEMGEFEVYLDL